MAAGGTEQDIFDSAQDTEEPPREITNPPSPEDKAVSDAIRGLGRHPETAPPPTPPAASPPPTPEHHDDDRSSVPLRVLLDERERRQEMARRLERFEQMERERQQAEKQPPLSQRLFEDPDGTIAAIEQKIREQEIAPIRNEIAQLQVNHDFAMASVRHPDVFQEAWQTWYGAVGQGQNAALYFAVMNSPSPGEALVQWYGQQRRNAEVGDDLDAYKQRVIDEWLASQGQAPRPRNTDGTFAPRSQAPRLPTATSRMGAAGNGNVEADEDGSEESIFAAGRPERRR